MMMLQEQARMLAATGAQVLDARQPGWALLIDIGRLDMGSCADCILGQLAGIYVWSGQTALADLVGDGGKRAIELGFDLSMPEPVDQEAKIRYRRNMRVLQDAWVEEIADRVRP